MNFTIIGAGALGSIIGAHLIKMGHDVGMVARGRRASQLRDQGLSIRGLVDLDVSCNCIETPQSIESTDVLLFAVKTYHLEDAIAATRHINAAHVFSVANGVLKNDQLSGVFGIDHVLGCMADTSGELHADGQVNFTRNVCLYVGDLNGSLSSGAKTIAHAIDEAGVKTQAVGNIATVEWSKFVGWIALFSLCVLGRAPTGRCLANPDIAAIGVRQVKEMGAIAAALGIVLVDQSPLPVATIIEQPFEDAVQTIRGVGETFMRTAPTHRMSSLQDLEAGRRLEVDGTLGYAVRTAQERKIEVPTLRICLGLVSGIDALQS